MRFLKISFSEEKIIKDILKILSIFILFLVIEYVAFRQVVVDLSKWKDPKVIQAALLFFCGYTFSWVWYKIRERVDIFLDNAIFGLKNALKGRFGEKESYKKLKTILGNQYKIYPNFKIPRENFDIDFVVVGPKGVIAIEVKNISGTYDFIGEDTYKHDRHKGNECICKLSEYQSPSHQSLRHSIALENWLRGNGFNNVKPKRIILFTGIDSNIIKLEPSGYFVVKKLEDLPGSLESTQIDSRFDADFCEKLNNLFSNYNK